MKKFKKILSLMVAMAMMTAVLSITVNAETEELATFEGETVNYGRTFENLTASEVESWYNDSQKTSGGFRSWTRDGVVTGRDGGKAFSPVYGMTAVGRTAEFYSIPKPTTGVQHYRFDYRPGTSETVKRNINLLNGEAYLVSAVKADNLTGTAWYNIDLVIDYGNHAWSIKAVPYDNALTTFTNSGTFASDNSGINLKFEYENTNPLTERTDTTVPAIDNFYWTTEKPKEEKLATFEGETVNYGRTFENLTASEVESWYNDSQKTSGGFRSWTRDGVVTGRDGGKAFSPVYGMTAVGRTAEFYSIPKPTTGVQHYRFDYRPGTSETVKRNINLLNGEAYLVSAVKADNLTGTAWYNIDLVIDYGNHAWSIKAVPYDNALTTFTNSGTFASDNSGINLKFEYENTNPLTERTDTTVPAIDNFYWTTEKPKEEKLATFEGETVNYGRTFENLTASEVKSWRTDDQKTAGGFRTWTDEGVVTGRDGGKAFSPVYGATNNVRSAEFYSIPTPTTGVQHYRFDYRPGTSEDTYNRIQLFYLSGGWLANAIDSNTLNGTKWYNTDLVIDYDGGTWSIEAIPYDTALTTYTNSGTFTAGSTLYPKFDNNSSTPANRTDTTVPAIDNFYWTTSNLINVLQSAVTITDKFGNAASDWKAVNPAVSTIAIDFGTEMNRSTLTSDTIKLLDETGAAVICTRSYSNNVYTLTPSATMLSGETTYQIVISQNVESADNKKVKAVKHSFTTGKCETDITGEDTIANFTFDDCDTVSDLPQVENFANEIGSNGWKTWGGNSIISGGRDGSGKAFRIGMDSWTSRSAEYFFKNAVDSGKMKIELSVKPATEDTLTIGIFESTRGSTNAIFTAVSAATAENKAGGKLLAGTNNWNTTKDYTENTAATAWTAQWYDIDALLDFDTSMMQINIKSADNAINFTGTYPMGISKLNGMQFLCDGASGSQNVLLDNLKIYMVYGEAPALSADSFKIYAGDEVQNNFNAVNSFTDKVSVDFGQNMKIADMSSANIYITEKNKDTKLTTVDSYSNGIYTMVIADTLKANTTYTIHVKSVANVSGYATAEEYTLDFTMGAGTYKSELVQMIAGGKQITAVSDITADTETQIEFDYFNSFGTAKTLYVIVAYYNDDALVKADYVKYPVQGDITSGTYRTDYKIPSNLPKFDSVKIMSWDGFDTMLPLGGYLEFN